MTETSRPNVRYKELSEPARKVPIVDEADVLVIGGGPAGVGAAVAAARLGARTVLTERYGFLGGMAAGGMVLVVDDMMDGDVQTVLGLAQEYVDRLEQIDAAVYPPLEDRYQSSQEAWDRWARWGAYDLYARQSPKPITYAVAFDPDGWKRISLSLVREAGVQLRLHSWFSAPLSHHGRLSGAVFETPAGRQAINATIVIDTTGDAAVAVRAGAGVEKGQYIVTLVHRYGNVDTERALKFEREHPDEALRINREVKRILGGSWEFWWLLTPAPGVVWCNCPHMRNIDSTSVEALTEADWDARTRIYQTYEFVKANAPGFERAFLIDTAPQIGVRQGGLLRGEYVVTADDIKEGRWFPDSVARGRDYYTPYRSLIPHDVDQLLVAGRCYSATPAAQRISREIGPCIVMGQAAGVAAVVAIENSVPVRDAPVRQIQAQLRAQGADPGDHAPDAPQEQPSVNPYEDGFEVSV